MVKHNNQIPNIHCKKKYLQSSRGPLKVKLSLNQATQKKARRIKRAAKRAAAAPAPVEKLRPVVHCPTQKYSAKVRLGRGFTLEELTAVKLHPSYAQRVGIAIDWRRKNRSEETMTTNIQRLEEYKSKLVILKKGDATPESVLTGGLILPLVKTVPTIEMMAVTDELKAIKAFTTMRVVRHETAIEGYRISVENRKKNE